MADSKKPGTVDQLLESAAAVELATHRVALYLEQTDDWVREHPGEALTAVLGTLPRTGRLRRARDRDLIEAMRLLARELPATHARKNHILMRLSTASRQAAPED
jgi:hypothetical protein